MASLAARSAGLLGAVMVVACSADLDEGPPSPASTTSTATGVGGSGGDRPDASAGGTSAGGGPGGRAGGGGAPPTGQGCIVGDFVAYRGNFHAHTSFSDGADEPEDAFAHARDVAGLDIMVVTDHLEQLYLVPPFNRWGVCKTQANAANAPGTFLADCGFEYGSGVDLPLCISTGHNNVFFAPSLFPAIQEDFHDFYDTLVTCSQCVGQFNHPGDESCQHWNFFEYDAAADERIALFELNGGGPAWEMLFQALDAGWHVAPMNNQDNHSANWGTADDRRSGVYLSSLTRDALRQAMLDRRTFASTDRDAAITLMAESACWMGSVLTGYGSVALAAHVEDPVGADGFASLELFGPGQSVLASVDCAGAASCDLSHSVDVVTATYALARAVQADGETLVSAPIWMAP